MNAPRPARRLTALIAAYAVALQLFLPAAFAIASPDGTPICSTLAEDGAHSPGPGHRGGTSVPDCCGVMCHGPVLATPPVPVSIASPAATLAAQRTQVAIRFAPPPHRGPQSPRAPPAA